MFKYIRGLFSRDLAIDLGTAGDPGSDCSVACAELTAAELGWDHDRHRRELAQLNEFFEHRGLKKDFRRALAS